ncbi:hypothetical protein [Robbsia andropogonis]|uniref:hypothetical protein n=2 Tax=Robbsia andropogonis TaxID=28092 RepID=UPI002A6A96B4|nr:hypothetical protein [Robbsia andropogonis]
MFPCRYPPEVYPRRMRDLTHTMLACCGLHLVSSHRVRALHAASRPTEASPPHHFVAAIPEPPHPGGRECAAMPDKET